ncbi:hypothetical protein PC116_g1655 [Phytophthora cactorum]|uniref:Copine C-terminal domain-containing protein n=1 Tax=Phytophthora cactorum TaxID=29920 RepID=A0A8T1LUN9_9STRA|nr:hypothetical protein PC112_g1521 [Phytophthora cactorum]KAG2848363.1 hypothetical protein PC111_g436 [Phytophthora cactorum]KAG2868754.1 hypothetical protein PC113_g783 [Phytophthora cactorum]KAG2934410.1 hypothetical protein PC114_g983 [Phytophthora cactorum]KAG2944066.1 hypothetical protein PC115_g476 [Phytophthora cactorum]
MGCAASTERQGELRGVLRWSGLRSTNLIIGIDFTRSNMWNGKHSFGGRYLHFVDPTGLDLNPYQIVVNIIGRTLHSRKNGSPCRGVGHILKRYTEITPELVLEGPTNFAPIIYHAIRRVKASGTCQILVIIADGQVTSEKETSQAVAEASKYALSIIVVGVGDGPWKEMEQYKSTLPMRKFENFHFVNLNRVMRENPEQPALSLAIAALAHIPDQLAAIRRLGLLQTSKND